MKRLQLLILLTCIGISGCGNKEKPDDSPVVEEVADTSTDEESKEEEEEVHYVDAYLQMFGYNLVAEPKCYRIMEIAADQSVDLTEYNISNNALARLASTTVLYVGTEDIWYVLPIGNTAVLVVKNDNSAVLGIFDPDNRGCAVLCEIPDIEADGEPITYPMNDKTIEDRTNVDEECVRKYIWVGKDDIKLKSVTLDASDLKKKNVLKGLSKEARSKLKMYTDYSAGAAAIAVQLASMPNAEDIKITDIKESSYFGMRVETEISGNAHTFYASFANKDKGEMVVWYEVF